MTRKAKSLFSGAVIILLLGASAAGAASRQYLTISLKEKRVKDMNSESLTLLLYLNIANASSSHFFLQKYDYRVVIGQTEYLQLQTALDQPILIRPSGDTVISLPLKVTYALLYHSVAGTEGQERVSCVLSGGMSFADERGKQDRIPFAFSAEFPVYKDLKVTLHPLLIKDLTVGGADLVFEVTFSNENSFDFDIARMPYKLEMGRELVSEGVISNPGVIKSKGELKLTFPLLLEFFEVGQMLYPKLGLASIPGRFSGEFEATTVWGSQKFPFDKKQEMPISRRP